jgi:hypothetical protein
VVADPLEEEQPLVDGTTLRTTFRIERIAVDVEGVLGALNRSAAEAARALAANPTDGPAIEAFRGALRPAPGAAPADRPEYPSTTAVPIGVSTIACDVVAVGDGREPRLDFGYRLGGAHLDLARMLKDSTELTIAFGAQLAGDARRPFDVALHDSVGPEQLGPIAAAVPGRTPTLTAGPGSVGAVESHYATAPEPPGPDDADDDEDQPDMYAVLRKRQPTGQ